MFGYTRTHFPEFRTEKPCNNLTRIKLCWAPAKMTPLLEAALSPPEKRIDLMCTLLEHGADPNKYISGKYVEGCNIFFVLCAEERFLAMSFEEQKQVFETLIKYGATFKAHDFSLMVSTILRFLEEEVQEKMVDLFMLFNFDLRKRDNRGLALLDKFFEQGCVRAVRKYLLPEDVDTIKRYHVLLNERNFLEIKDFLTVDDVTRILNSHLIKFHTASPQKILFHLSCLPREVVDKVIEDIFYDFANGMIDATDTFLKAFICCTMFLSNGISLRDEYIQAGCTAIIQICDNFAKNNEEFFDIFVFDDYLIL